MLLIRSFFFMAFLACTSLFHAVGADSPSPTGGADIDPDLAQRTFRTCAACHTLSQSGEHRAGPNLFGLMTRDIATAPGYNYSQPFGALEGRWTAKRLSAFLEKPRDFVPRSKMAYHGIKSAAVRDNLVAWLLAVTSTENTPTGVDDIAVTLAAGNADNGRALFRPCMACHSFREGEGARIGPNLFGIVGRPTASFPGFRYSDALEKRNTVWSPAELNRFFIEKKPFDQGSHLAFRDLPTLEARADLIAWLETLQPRPLDANAVTRTGKE